MKIEEAALTGESVPVTKTTDVLYAGEAKDVPLGDRKNMVYMGSTVVYGRGAAVICATGMDTEMGKIADALAQAQEGKTPLQIKLTQLSKILTVLVLAICVIIFAVSLLRAGSLDGKVLLDTFMIAVSLAVAAIPEGLAAVVTIVLSIGVTNMSKQNAIIRKLTAVEHCSHPRWHFAATRGLRKAAIPRSGNRRNARWSITRISLVWKNRLWRWRCRVSARCRLTAAVR